MTTIKPLVLVSYTSHPKFFVFLQCRVFSGVAISVREKAQNELKCKMIRISKVPGDKAMKFQFSTKLLNFF